MEDGKSKEQRFEERYGDPGTKVIIPGGGTGGMVAVEIAVILMVFVVIWLL